MEGRGGGASKAPQAQELQKGPGGIGLKSKTETEKFSDLIGKHICYQHYYKIWDSETH